MGRNRTGVIAADPAATDGVLAALAADGDVAAFEELYRRHAQAAWRVAQAVTRNAEDASDAVAEAFARVLKALPAGRLRDNANFRSYLLTSTRNAALDVHRRTGRVKSTDDDTVFDSASGDGPSDAAIDKADLAMVATAFSSLPERWRSVLWLTEVEDIPAREAAGMLGVSANGVAQLAVRARAGLRERFLQAHLGAHGIKAECRTTVDRLGAYVAGALAPRDLAKVDQHLAGCADCRARLAELEELGSSLRRIVIPIPLGLGALVLGKATAASAASAAAAVGAKTGEATPAWLLKAQRPLAVMSVGLFAGGIVGLGVVGQPGVVPGSGSRPTISPADVAAPAVTFTPAAAFSGGSASGSGGFSAAAGTGTSGASGTGGSDEGSGDGFDSGPARDGSAGETARSLPDRIGNGGDDSGGDGDGNGGPPTTTPPPPPPPPPGTTTTPEPTAQLTVTVRSGSTTAAVGAGSGSGSCTAIVVGPVPNSCAPPAPTGTKPVTIETDGTVPGEKTVGLP